MALELYRPSDRLLSAKLVPIFTDKGCHVVSVTDPRCCILGFQQSKSKLYYDRHSVGQSVLVSGAHLGPATNASPLSLIIFRQLWVC
jgi:hypothetical protein